MLGLQNVKSKENIGNKTSWMHICFGQISKKYPWTIIHVAVSLDNCHLGQKSSLDNSLPWTIVFLGQKSAWTTINLDKSPLDNCHLGQSPLGQLLQHP